MYQPNFTITLNILNAVSEITSVKVIVERSKVLPLNEAQLQRQAIVRMAHTSTSIEGNKLAEYQVDKVLSGMSISADEKSIIEVKNYQLALKEMERLVGEQKFINIEDILKLHKILMDKLVENEKAGHFRLSAIYIIDDLGDGREILRYEGPPHSKVAHLTNELLKWVVSQKDILHPILLAGIFHSQFVHIHPFTDGNGRMSRVLTSYILYRLGWDFRKIIVLEDYYNRDRQGYYNALAAEWNKKYHQGANMTPWLEYFVNGFLVEARKVYEAIAVIGFAKGSDGDSQIYLDNNEVKIMDFLTTTGKITSNDVVEILGIAKRTAQLKLKNLTEKKLIKSEGSGPSTYYVLTA